MTTVNPATGQPADLDWLLEQFVNRVPHARSAVVASTDGVRKHLHGLTVDDGDRLSAIATGLFSLGRGIGHLSGGANGEVRQVIVEHDGALLFVSAAGTGAILAVLAGAQADPALIGYEMGQLVKSVAAYLATPPRSGLGQPAEAGR